MKYLGLLIVALSAGAQSVFPPPIGSGTGGGSTAIQVDGGAIAAEATVNFVNGTCASVSGLDAGSVTDVTVAVNTAVCPTKANIQSGASLNLTETSSSATVYVFTMSPTLTAYTANQRLNWKVVQACTGGTATTVNVDTLGAKSLKLADGATDPTSTDCAAGRTLTVAYDGTLFRIVAGGAAGGGSLPADSAASGNGLYYPFGACVDCVSAALVDSANQGHGAQFVNPATWTSRYAQLTIGATASGASCTGGTCGLIMGIFSADTATAKCVTEVGTSGNGTARKNINDDFSQAALAWSSGSAVAGGVCTLPAGVYWLFYSSDSTALTGLGIATAFALEGLNAVNVKWAYMNSMTTGNGASIAFAAGPFSLTTQTGLGHKLSQIILEN